MSEPPELTDSPVLPEVRATVTVTFDVGAVDSETPKVPVEPWVTDSEAGLATTAGVVAGLTVTERALAMVVELMVGVDTNVLVRLLTADDAALRVKQHQPVTTGIATHPRISVIIHIHRVTLDGMIMYEK